MRRNLLFILLGIVLCICSLYAEIVPSLPVIPALDSRDTIFRQYLEDVEAARRVLFMSGRVSPESAADNDTASLLTIYSYIPRGNDDLFGIAARCNIPYGTLISLNRLSHKEDMVDGRPLLLPSVPGIFIPERPEKDLERLLSSARLGAGEDTGVVVSIPGAGKTVKFRFFPGDDLSPVERVFFLNRGFGFPLRNFYVSSFYGPRINPVTGKAGIHRGIDLAAPEGTEVYTVRAGTVIDLGEDPVLGKYIIISHENNWVSIYGHLSAFSTVLHARLQSTNLIGRVGSTGQSTGPHLHFELRQSGESRDPAGLLGIFKGSTSQSTTPP